MALALPDLLSHPTPANHGPAIRAGDSRGLSLLAIYVTVARPIPPAPLIASPLSPARTEPVRGGVPSLSLLRLHARRSTVQALFPLLSLHTTPTRRDGVLHRSKNGPTSSDVRGLSSPVGDRSAPSPPQPRVSSTFCPPTSPLTAAGPRPIGSPFLSNGCRQVFNYNLRDARALTGCGKPEACADLKDPSSAARSRLRPELFERDRSPATKVLWSYERKWASHANEEPSFCRGRTIPSAHEMRAALSPKGQEELRERTDIKHYACLFRHGTDGFSSFAKSTEPPAFRCHWRSASPVLLPTGSPVHDGIARYGHSRRPLGCSGPYARPRAGTVAAGLPPTGRSRRWNFDDRRS
ncbi:hypothetical protein C8Q78DRAFT_1060750 [Trametes maxima]|nr:hypothetical protein C8Q78DRAFT_1060750 [Trametes maxima]